MSWGAFLVWLALYGIASSLLSIIGWGGPVWMTLALVASGAGAYALISRRFQAALAPAGFIHREQDRLIEDIWMGLLAFFCCLSFFYLLYESRGTWWTRNPNNIGDLPLHAHFINYFARGGTLADSHPLLNGAPFKYPAAIDLWNAAWQGIGVPLRVHLFATGAIATVLLLKSLRAWMGWWGVFAFVMSGGFASAGLGHGWGPGADLSWKNLFLAVWVTQRGFLFALPAGIFLLLTHLRWMRGEQTLTTREKQVLCIVWTALPFFHLHSFLIVNLLLALQCWTDRQSVVKNLIATARLFVWGLPVVLVPLLRTTGEAQAALHWSWNWMAKSGSGTLFWIKNFGLWLLIPLVVIFNFKKSPVVIAGMTVMTLLFCNLMLAPWAWDQIKILLWLYLYWNFLFFRHVWTGWHPVLKILSMGLVFFPGVHQWLGGLPSRQAQLAVWTVADVELAQRAVRDLPVHESVLVAPEYNHPMLATGQQLWMGYEGHLWSHKLDYAAHKKLVDDLKNNRFSLQNEMITPRWVLLGPKERDILSGKQQETSWQIVDFKSLFKEPSN